MFGRDLRAAVPAARKTRPGDGTERHQVTSASLSGDLQRAVIMTTVTSDIPPGGHLVIAVIVTKQCTLPLDVGVLSSPRIGFVR
jgi:hypothetical protein